MSYNFLDHATDAFIEIRAKDLHEAFVTVANAVINTTIDQDKVEEKEIRFFEASGKDLRYLLFSWLEELNFLLITEGFAIARIELEIIKDKVYIIKAKAYGEPLNLQKHNFKVEIKAPTFYDMEIKRNGQVYMKFLLDL